MTDRQETHGHFETQMSMADELESALASHPQWEKLPRYVRASLRQVLHKLSRIVAGNYQRQDHWSDIVGYVELTMKQIEQEQLGEARTPNAQSAPNNLTTNAYSYPEPDQALLDRVRANEMRKQTREALNRIVRNER